MHSDRTIGDAELSKLWRITRGRLSTWHSSGKLESEGRYGGGARATHWYSHGFVDDIHQGWRIRPDVDFPPVALLLDLQQKRSDGHALLTLSEAAAILELNPRTVVTEARRGNLVGIKVGGTQLRFPITTIESYMAQLDVLPLSMAAGLLGIHENSVRALTKGNEPPLASTHQGNPKTLVVFTESLLRYLESHLARASTGELFYTAEEWRAMRVQYNYEELLTTDEIQKRWRTHQRVVHRHIRDGTFPCLWTQGGQARIPLHAVDQWSKWRNIVPPGLVAQTLGVTMVEAERLISSRLLCSIRHQPCPTTNCYRRYLNSHRTNANFTAQDWVNWCTQDGAPLTRHSEVVQKNLVSQQELDLAIALGDVRGLRLPDDGDIVLLLHDVRQLRQDSRRFMQSFSPDFHVQG